jgi:hypothetical protein
MFDLHGAPASEKVFRIGNIPKETVRGLWKSRLMRVAQSLNSAKIPAGTCRGLSYGAS